MDYSLTADQASILDGLEQLIEAHSPAAPTQPRTVYDAPSLEAALVESGYLGIAREADFGLLEAALVTERLARLPWAVEVAASALVAPALRIDAQLRPVALCSGNLDTPARFLRTAQVLLVLRDEEALLVRLEGAKITPVESLLAYPYGRLADCSRPVEHLGDARVLRRRWRIALAAEAAGCMAAALALVLEHVRNRHAFGRPLGAFQAIQHRLAMAAEAVEASRWLALRAAWSDSEQDAATAAGFAQAQIPQLTYDLHQFCGAMGLTLEFPLHLWTYRLRALLGELGGASAQLRGAAEATWGL
jgi:alkylation response protein AidB-like acyl-CoA dehydrogenase